jgi:hypothetical protein
MLRLMAKFLWLLPVLAGLILAARTLGKNQASSLPDWSALGFGACDLPCWAGIMPGDTLFDEAAAQLRTSLPALDAGMLVSNSQINFSATAPGQIIRGQLFYRHGRVGYVRLNLVLPAGDFIARLGAPDCLWLNAAPQSRQGMVALYWASGRVSAIVLMNLDSAGSWTPTTEAQGFWLDSYEGVCSQAEALPWKGFTPGWRYRRLSQVVSP